MYIKALYAITDANKEPLFFKSVANGTNTQSNCLMHRSVDIWFTFASGSRHILQKYFKKILLK